jgi:hypothetical protein
MPSELHQVAEYEWGRVLADDRDPNAGGASHYYEVQDPDNLVLALVEFQHGPRREPGSRQGALDEHLFAILADRLEAFQAGPFPCEANAQALSHLQAARALLRSRHDERRERDVIGLNLP